MAWCLDRLIYSYGRPYGTSRACIICGKDVYPIGWLVRDEYNRVGMVHEGCGYTLQRCK